MIGITVLIVMFFALPPCVVIYLLLRHLIASRVVTKKAGNTGAVDAAIEALITMGWKKEDAMERVALAFKKCSEGDESKLVNIAIRL